MTDLPTKINILGEIYDVSERTEEEAPLLAGRMGYTDETTKTITLLHLTRDNVEVGNLDRYRGVVLRHEIIHAYLFESGLGDNMNEKPDRSHDEEMVDWFALQYPKLKKTFALLGVG